MNNVIKNKKSLKFRITVSSLLVVLLSTVLLSILSYNVISKKFQNQVKEDGLILTEEISNEIQTNNIMLNQIDKLLSEKISAVANLVGNNTNFSNEYLTEIAKSINIQEINISNAAGVILYSNLSENINYKYPSDHPIQPLLKGSQGELIEKTRKSTSSSNGDY